MNIPKIIHHIAPADEGRWHPFWHKCRESWIKEFPDYQFILWNDREDIDNFVRDHYPQYWNLYNAFPVHIMRIDFVRLCILHKYGGIYADMDIFCYKNFDDYLTKDIYFLENLTLEYTSARWENSMMASTANHRLLEELMLYVKTCFIHFRTQFVKRGDNWRTQENDSIINNTTGSGMISKAIEMIGQHFDVGVFNCQTFNNRPVSYDQSFYTKHIHTSVWGNEYIDYTKNDLDRLLIINGCAYSTGEPSEETKGDLDKRELPYEVVLNEDFDFHKDYTRGVYLKDHNLEEIKQIVMMKH